MPDEPLVIPPAVESLPEDARPRNLPPAWEDVQGKFAETFPDLDPREMEKQYGHARKLAIARRSIPEGETAGQFALRRVAPFISQIHNLADTAEYQAASKRFQAGEPEESDYDRIAAFEHLQEADKNRSLGGKVLSGLAHLPALVGEFGAGGAALRGVGAAAGATSLVGRTLAPEAAAQAGVQVPKLLSMAGLAQAGARNAATTAVVPSMYAEGWAKNNMEAGRDALDPRGLPSAYAMGMLQNAVLAGAGKMVNIPGQGVGPWIARASAKTGVAVGAMTGVADPVASLVSEILPRGYKLETGYGPLGDAFKGHWGDAGEKLAVQFATFAAFESLHAHREPQSMEALANFMAQQKKSNKSLPAALKAAGGVADTLAEAMEKNPDLKWDDAQKLLQDIPEGSLRDLGNSLTEGFLAKEQAVEPIEHIPGEFPEPPPPEPPAATQKPQEPQPGQPPAQPTPEPPQAPPEAAGMIGGREADVAALAGKESQQGLPPREEGWMNPAEKAKRDAEVRRMMGMPEPPPDRPPPPTQPPGWGDYPTLPQQPGVPAARPSEPPPSPPKPTGLERMRKRQQGMAPGKPATSDRPLQEKGRQEFSLKSEEEMVGTKMMGGKSSPREDLLARIELNEGGLTDKEKDILKQRLVSATSFAEIGKKYGVSNTTIQNWEISALEKLGHKGTVDQLHLQGRAGQAMAEVEKGKEMAGQELHNVDRHGASHNARINQIEQAVNDLNELLDRKAKDQKSGKFTAKRRLKFSAEHERLRRIIDEGQGETGTPQGQPGETPGVPGDVAGRGTEQQTPVQPEAGPGVPEGGKEPTTPPPQQGSEGPATKGATPGTAPGAGGEAPGNELRAAEKAVEASRQALQKYGFARGDIEYEEKLLHKGGDWHRAIESAVRDYESGTDEANPQIGNEQEMMRQHLRKVAALRDLQDATGDAVTHKVVRTGFGGMKEVFRGTKAEAEAEVVRLQNRPERGATEGNYVVPVDFDPETTQQPEPIEPAREGLSDAGKTVKKYVAKYSHDELSGFVKTLRPGAKVLSWSKKQLAEFLQRSGWTPETAAKGAAPGPTPARKSVVSMGGQEISSEQGKPELDKFLDENLPEEPARKELEGPKGLKGFLKGGAGASPLPEKLLGWGEKFLDLVKRWRSGGKVSIDEVFDANDLTDQEKHVIRQRIPEENREQRTHDAIAGDEEMAKAKVGRRPQEMVSRDQKIIKGARSGRSQKSLADEYGVSQVRVGQIIRAAKTGGRDPDEPKADTAKPYTRARIKQIEQEALQKLGLPEDFSLADLAKGLVEEQQRQSMEKGQTAELASQAEPESVELRGRERMNENVNDPLDSLHNQLIKEMQENGGELSDESLARYERSVAAIERSEGKKGRGSKIGSTGRGFDAEDSPAGRGAAKSIWDHAAEFAAGESGSQSIDWLQEKAGMLWRRLGGAVHYTADAINKLGSKTAPRTQRESVEAANAIGRFTSVSTFTQLAVPDYVARTFGKDAKPEEAQKDTAVLVERALRYTKQQKMEASRKASNAAADARAVIADPTSTPQEKAQARKDASEQAKRATEFMIGAREVVSTIGSKDLPDFDTYKAHLKSPHMQEVISNWREGIGKEMDKNFRDSMGLEATDPINSLVQIPGEPINLLAVRAQKDVTDSTATITGLSGAGGRGNLRNPRMGKNLLATARTGANVLGYETDPSKVIENTLRLGYGNAAKANMYRALESEGVAYWGTGGDRKEGYKEIPNVTPPRGTQAAEAGQGSLWVKESAYKEVRQALGVDDPHNYGPLPAVNSILTSASLFSTVEGLSHMKNMMTMLFKPGVSIIDFFKNGYNYLKGDPTTMKELTELARQGAMKEAGPESGVLLGGKLANFDPTYWTSRGIDALQRVMRLTAADGFDRLVKRGQVKGTEAELEGMRRDFVNQLGNYNRRTQNQMVVWLRDTAFGPFATAASNYAIQGVRTAMLDPGVKASSLGSAVLLRAEFLAKIALFAGGAALSNYLMHKRVDGDDNTPLGAVKVGMHDGRTQYIDFTALTGLTRGLRATGLLALAEGARKGETTSGKTLDKSRDQIVASLLHPAMGPGPSFAHTAATGKNTLGIQVAEKAQPKLGPSPRHPTGQEEGWQSYHDFKAALANANPAYAALTGSDRPKEEIGLGERLWKLAGPLAVKEKGDSGKPLPGSARALTEQQKRLLKKK